MLYPRDFGFVTAGSGNTTHIGVSYNALRVQGYNYGWNSNGNGKAKKADDCLFTNVSLETEFGYKDKTVCRMPLMTGALGSTFIAAKYWESFAVGCALVGIPIVVGENVVGVDKKSEIKNGKIVKSPELDRRVDTYMRFHDGYGAIIIQLKWRTPATAWPNTSSTSTGTRSSSSSNGARARRTSAARSRSPASNTPIS
jgi:hypothetical protein